MGHWPVMEGGDGITALFRDRADAGKRLANKLSPLRDQAPVVLALPRGGVAVAVEIARRLHAPLGLVLVRKLGAPYQPELAIGAIASCVAGGNASIETVINANVGLPLPDSWLEEETHRQLKELERRRTTYLAGRRQPSIAGCTVILVDDGIATGATMLAALRAVRKEGPKALLLAIPVAPADSLAAFTETADSIICLETPAFFVSIGAFYRDFRQLDDSDVIDLLDAAGQGTTGFP